MTFDLSSDRLMMALTLATVFGMGLAAFGAFVVPGLWGPAGLLLVYLAGGVPAGLRALWTKTMSRSWARS